MSLSFETVLQIQPEQNTHVHVLSSEPKTSQFMSVRCQGRNRKGINVLRGPSQFVSQLSLHLNPFFH